MLPDELAVGLHVATAPPLPDTVPETLSHCIEPSDLAPPNLDGINGEEFTMQRPPANSGFLAPCQPSPRPSSFKPPAFIQDEMKA
ncbi:hypothetical protein PAXINDRAFT_18519 [Paxillus involutus ATCC 200175]|uniref:Unplaced genomic scaffold PAXINscaffold_322, whole genome shotgun sequence n=1 Tax=Paxillus involutus ATCC 200175 TaxID=664439 RepID=A0A0C9SYS1_PAXIN|nr:hypothetical protein PAXINDRAFT_18519 [Paxillus involutus ATCC 200175]